MVVELSDTVEGKVIAKISRDAFDLIGRHRCFELVLNLCVSLHASDE